MQDEKYVLIYRAEKQKEVINERKYRKIIEPKMRFDAFMANVKDGGLRSVSSIYMLVCYIVANMNKRVSAATIIEAVNDAMIANYFEISDAVNKLIKAGTINEGDDKMLYMDEQDVKEIALIEKTCR